MTSPTSHQILYNGKIEITQINHFALNSFQPLKTSHSNYAGLMLKLIIEETNFIRCMEITDFTDAYYDCMGYDKCLVHGVAKFEK
jgi:hypothetical protein